MALERLKRHREQMKEWQRNARTDPEYRQKGIEYNSAAYHERGVGNTRALAAQIKTPIDGIACPCCQQSVRVPSLAIVIDHYKVTPLEARILGAIWKGKGHPVQTERIFDAMYADDPDGGPSPTRMYAAFKVALCHLRVRLGGSGVSIENVGYRRGYRLVMGA